MSGCSSWQVGETWFFLPEASTNSCDIWTQQKYHIFSRNAFFTFYFEDSQFGIYCFPGPLVLFSLWWAISFPFFPFAFLLAPDLILALSFSLSFLRQRRKREEEETAPEETAPFRTIPDSTVFLPEIALLPDLNRKVLSSIFPAFNAMNLPSPTPKCIPHSSAEGRQSLMSLSPPLRSLFRCDKNPITE